MKEKRDTLLLFWDRCKIAYDTSIHIHLNTRKITSKEMLTRE